MLRLRLVEERLSAIYHEADEIKTPMHLYTGQEAAAVGVCAALRPDDTVSPYIVPMAGIWPRAGT